MKSGKFFVSVLLITTMFLGSCATVNSTMENMGKKEKIGTAGGAVAGAAVGGLIGKNMGGGKLGVAAGMLIGAGIGGYLGSRIGASFDARDKRLAKIKEKTGIDIQSTSYSALKDKEQSAFEAKLKKMDENGKQKAQQSKVIYKAVAPAQFSSGSAKLSSKMKVFFSEVAGAYKVDGVRKVMIVGHADSSGDASSNQRLSEKRAKAVARVFLKAGYPAQGIYYQGAGESEPVADNTTELGRATNRRVEMVDASRTQDLAMAKRFAIDESKKVMKKVKPKEQVKAVTIVAVAKNLSGTDSILPFHGEIYNGQQLLASGHKAKAAEKSGGFFDGLTAAIDKAKESVIGTAHASNEQLIPAFFNDDMASAGAIKRLDGQDNLVFEPSDHLPGYYKQPIYTYLDGDAFFSLQPVSVLKEEALTGQMPNMIVYKRYDGKGDKADAKLHGAARLYVSGDNMLYRWKANNQGVAKSGVLGIDVLLPTFKELNFKKTHVENLTAQVYYLKGHKIQVAKVKLGLKLNKESKIDWGV